MNVILAHSGLSDAGVITGTESVGDMTIGNLQKRSLKRKYRTTDLTPQINIDLGSAQSINCIAIIAHNGQGTVTVKAGSTDSVADYTSGSLDLITGTDLGYEKNLFFLFLETPQNYQYWQLDISDAGNSDGYFEAGRVYISNAFRPTTNIDYGVAEGFLDNSRVKRTRSGEAVPSAREPYKNFKFKFGFGSKEEMYGTLYDIDRLRGISKDVLFLSEPDETTHFQRRYIYGLMNDLQPIINTTFSIFQKSYEIEEIPA